MPPEEQHRTIELNPNSSNPNSIKHRSIPQRIRRGILIYAFVPYLAITLIFTVLQRRLLYQPTVADNLSISNVGLPEDFGTDVELKTANGTALHGWLVDQSSTDMQGSAPLVVYFPGNSLNRNERVNDLREVASRGFDVLIFDYRGFGDSTGRPTESALTNDARIVWQYATDTLGYDERRIVVFGESLGGAVALSMWDPSNTTQPQPCAVILNSTFASMPKTVAWHYPMFPFQFLLFDRWPSIDRIANVDSPVTIFHGTADKMIPLAQGQLLADASMHANFIEIQSGEHNDIPMLRLRELLNSILGTLTSNNSTADPDMQNPPNLPAKR